MIDSVWIVSVISLLNGETVVAVYLSEDGATKRASEECIKQISILGLNASNNVVIRTLHERGRYEEVLKFVQEHASNKIIVRQMTVQA